MSKQPKSQYKSYPEADGLRSGCKVSWRYYKDRAKAEECAKAAKWNAGIQRGQGYDFGYCDPGSISKAHENSLFVGMWEVCLP